MAFTKQNVSRMATQMRRAAGALLSPTVVELTDGGGLVEVRLHVGTRRVSNADVTGGISQEVQSATVDAEHWDSLVERPPQKGDVIKWADRRYAIEDSKLAAPAGVRTFYRATLKG